MERCTFLCEIFLKTLQYLQCMPSMKLENNLSIQRNVLFCKGNLMNYFTLICKNFVINTVHLTKRWYVFSYCVCFFVLNFFFLMNCWDWNRDAVTTSADGHCYCGGARILLFESDHDGGCRNRQCSVFNCTLTWSKLHSYREPTHIKSHSKKFRNISLTLGLL